MVGRIALSFAGARIRRDEGEQITIDGEKDKREGKYGERAMGSRASVQRQRERERETLCPYFT